MSEQPEIELDDDNTPAHPVYAGWSVVWRGVEPFAAFATQEMAVEWCNDAPRRNKDFIIRTWYYGIIDRKSSNDPLLSDPAPVKTRPDILLQAKRQVDEIEQYFRDVSHWNDTRGKVEGIIDPDPDGSLHRVAEALAAMLKTATTMLNEDTTSNQI